MSDIDPPDPSHHPAPSSDPLTLGVRYQVPPPLAPPAAPPFAPDARARVAERVAAARAASRAEIDATIRASSFAGEHRRVIIAGLGVVSAAVALLGAAALWTGGFRWAVLGPTLLFAAEALDCALALWRGREEWPLGLAWLP